MSFDAGERATLAALADVLIPAGAGFPSASEAGVAGEGLDKVLAARPDLAEGLRALLKGASGPPAEAVKRLSQESFGILAEIVPGAYFLNTQVLAKLGYAGQTPRAIDPRPDYLDEGLLQSVIDRGRIYRPTP